MTPNCLARNIVGHLVAPSLVRGAETTRHLLLSGMALDLSDADGRAAPLVDNPIDERPYVPVRLEAIRFASARIWKRNDS